MTLKDNIMDKLRNIVDPHLDENIVDAGLIKDVKADKGVVSIVFQPTSPYCPMVSYFTNEIEKSVKSLKGVKKLKIKKE